MLFSKTVIIVALIALQQSVQSTTVPNKVKRAIREKYPLIKEKKFSLYGPFRNNSQQIFYTAVYNESNGEACSFIINESAQKLTAELGTCSDISETNEGSEYCGDIFVCPGKEETHYYGLCENFNADITVKELPELMDGEKYNGSLPSKTVNMTSEDYQSGFDKLKKAALFNEGHSNIRLGEIRYGKIQRFEDSAEIYAYPATLFIGYNTEAIECKINLFKYEELKSTLFNVICGDKSWCGNTAEGTVKVNRTAEIDSKVDLEKTTPATVVKEEMEKTTPAIDPKAGVKKTTPAIDPKADVKKTTPAIDPKVKVKKTTPATRVKKALEKTADAASINESPLLFVISSFVMILLCRII